MMSNVIQTIEELDAVLHWRNKHAAPVLRGFCASTKKPIEMIGLTV
jgi:hypothetical protein